MPVSLHEDKQEEKILGAARLMSKAEGLEPEFATVVGDPWHGKGIGVSLMERLIEIAKGRGIESMPFNGIMVLWHSLCF